MAFFWNYNVAKTVWRPGSARTRWGSLQRSPRPSSWWGSEGAFAAPPQEPHFQYCHCACPVCMYTRV